MLLFGQPTEGLDATEMVGRGNALMVMVLVPKHKPLSPPTTKLVVVLMVAVMEALGDPVLQE